MFPVFSEATRSKRSFVMVLVLTTASAALLGGCNKSGGNQLLSGGAGPLSTSSAQLTDAQSNRTKVGQWAMAYSKNPENPKMVLGYAYALKATGNKQQALSVLKNGFQANPRNGEIAAQLGRVALELGRTDIAKASLPVAQRAGVDDWRTLSAQGTLLAKQGNHSEAQKYFQAALKKKPDSLSVVNNLALAYALDGKAAESEALLKKAVAHGGDKDPRVRQNLAMVLGLQGKYSEAKQVAAVGSGAKTANQNIAYLRNMLGKPTQVASVEPEEVPEPPSQSFNPFGPDGGYGNARVASAPPAPPARVAAVTTPAGNMTGPALRPAGQLPNAPAGSANRVAMREQARTSGSSTAMKRPSQPLPQTSTAPAIAKPYNPAAQTTSTVAKKASPPPAAMAQASPSAGNPAAAAALLRSDVE